MIEPVGLWVITAHLIADFPLQPDWMAEKKVFFGKVGDERIDGQVSLLIHVTIHGFMFAPIFYFTLPQSLWFPAIMWVITTHFVIDMNRWVGPKEGWGESWVWLNDQIMHFISLSLLYPFVYLL